MSRPVLISIAAGLVAFLMQILHLFAFNPVSIALAGLSIMPLLIVALVYPMVNAILATGIWGILLYVCVGEIGLIHQLLSVMLVLSISATQHVGERNKYFSVGSMASIIALLSTGMMVEAASVKELQATLSHMSEAGLEHIELLTPVFPGLMAFAWSILALFNIAMAQKIAQKQGLIHTSKAVCPIFWPYWDIVLVGSALATLFVSKEYSYMLYNFVIVSSFPLLVQGGYVLKFLANRYTSHSLWFTIGIILTFFFAWPLILIVALGVVDSWTGLAKRLSKE